MENMGVTENKSTESVEKSDKVSTLMESKNSNIIASQYPITPNFTKENVNFASLLATPLEDVFDPHTLLIPDPNQTNQTNQTSHPGTSVSRKLDFKPDECESKNEVENGSLMEIVYESVLETIICNQAEDILAEILDLDSSREPDDDVLRTPISVSRTAGLAETCPGAPVKPMQVGIPRVVSRRLCRKLDFDSYV